MSTYIKSGVLDNVFSSGRFTNTIVNYDSILYVEVLEEYETHLLPVLMRVCRNYLYLLPHTRPNTNFGSFDRSTSPIPVPSTIEEQGTPIDVISTDFTAYSLPYPVDNSIQKFRKNPRLHRPQMPPNSVHPESRILLFLLRHDK